MRNNPHDLINVAVERLSQEGLELPGFSTLAKIASKVRGEINAQLFRRVWERISPMERLRLQHLLVASGPDGRSGLDRLRKPARRASWSRFKAQAEHLSWADGLGRTEDWLEGVAATKIGDFAGECAAQDAASLGDYGPVKRVVLLACLVHEAGERARDDLAEMLCKRVSRNIKKAKAELEEIRLRQRTLTEALVDTYRAMVEQLAPEGPAAAAQRVAGQRAQVAGLVAASEGQARPPAAGMGGAAMVLALAEALRVQAAGIAAARSPIERAGGFAAQLAAIEQVSAIHGDNYELLAQRYFKKDRPVLFDLVSLLKLEATTRDDSVLVALEHALRHENLTRDYIPDHDAEGRPIAVSFATANWQKVIRDRKHSGTFVRRHFEACVFTYLADELRGGDVAVEGAAEYGNWMAQQLPWEQCEPMIAGFCAEADLPATASEFTAQLKQRLTDAAAALDAGYDNADLVIDPDGVPTLKRRRAVPPSDSALRLAKMVTRRMPERSLLGIVARSAYWVNWWRHFGPASGHQPRSAMRRAGTRCRLSCTASTWAPTRPPGTSPRSPRTSCHWSSTGTSTPPS